MTYREFLERKRLIDVPSGFEPVRPINPMLFDFQADIVRWAIRRGRAAVFADCGLGKTPIQLEWADHVSKRFGGNILILAPLAVASQTVREGEKFGIKVTPCRTQADVRPGINITNYEMLHHFDPQAFFGVVLDESSILKSYTGKFRNQIIQAFQSTPYRLACTATPAPNDYMELGNHSEFLGVMTRAEMLAMFFVHDGGRTSQWRLKGHAESEFWRWLCSWAVMLRKPSDLGYEDGGFQLPELRIHQTTVASGMRPEGMLFALEAHTLEERREARKASIDARVKACADIVNSTPGPWVVWCNLNEESAKAAAAIEGAVEVKGSDSPEHKERAMVAFANGEIRVLVTKPTIAGFGMNWQHCHNVAFLGLSDSYEQFYQAVRRCWRFGQTKPVDVHVIVSDLEGAVVRNIERKERDAERMAREMVAHMADISSQEIRGIRRETMEYRRDVARGENWTLYLGDCVEVIPEEIETESVGFSVFSPPFASLYTYSNSPRDMGNCKDYDEFTTHFRFLITELLRVTKPGRLCAVHCMTLPTHKCRDGEIGLRDFRGDIVRAFVAEGWIFHSEVCIWKDPVTAMQRTKALGLLYKQLRKDSCMSRQGLPDYVVVFRKPGTNPEPVGHRPEDFPLELWQRYASPVWMDIDPQNTLNYRAAREERDERHICPLQLDVIERCLLLWSNPGDLVLSPFAGIGSEGYQALKMGRRFVGVELKESYWRQAVQYLEEAESEKGKQLSLLAV